ncbi:MAG TPA: lysozyme, partial [Caulobacteraceae bacterium]
PDGRWTLGYGHTLTARRDAEVSEEDAEALLLYDLIGVAHVINEHTFAPLNQNQFDALASFVFNIGPQNYRGSAVLRRLNEGEFLHAAACMEMWRKADIEGQRIVVDALIRRRAAEKYLFLTPPDGWPVAPTPVVPPRVDFDAIEALSLQTPQSLTALLYGDRTLAKAGEAPPEERSASERAADDIAQRLAQIVPDQDEPAAPTLRLTPATEFDFEPDAEAEPEPSEPPQDGPTLFEAAGPIPAGNPAASHRMVLEDVSGRARPGSWLGAFVPIALAALGMAVSAGALAWGFYAQGTVGLVDPQKVSWVGGIAGVCMMAIAAYLALRRLGEPTGS